VLSKTRGKLEPGEAITLVSWNTRTSLTLRLVAKMEGGTWAVLPDDEGDPLKLLAKIGRVPLPPYIRDGEMTEDDASRYQTVFAKQPGAVAAPTAGLHFTPELLAALKKQGLRQEFITLHVGVGTFRPITAERLADHPMHSEWCSVSSQVVDHLRQTRRSGGRIVAVGTTVARTLESAAAAGELAPFDGPTDLFIRPPYEFRAVDALLTNFHLPKSTLLILVRTFGGDRLIQRAYEQAIAEQYRFYSYGDAMLVV
jgi:S-adenosylmethionine:tRNA ribosyltransferase-isomerase